MIGGKKILNDKKKYIFIGIGVVLLIVVLVCFLLALKKHNSDKTVTSTAESATAISSKYDDVDYGDKEEFTGKTISSGGTYDITG